MDKITPAKRSALMARIKGKNTQPELLVRSLLHSLGYRFRLHRKDLPGRPDIVLPKHRTVIFVQGCFWHGHNCRIASLPKSNIDYWHAKIARNQARDERNMAILVKQGWKVLQIWECEIRKGEEFKNRLIAFLAE